MKEKIKNFMSEKLIIFIIGLLLGTIISTGSIYFYTLANNSNNKEINMNRQEMNMPNNMPSDQNGTRPEMRNQNNLQDNVVSNGDNYENI